MLRLIVVISFYLFTIPAQAAGIDKVLAVVNNDVITVNEFSENLNRIKNEFRQSGSELPPEDILRRQILDRMILEKIQLQYAKLLGITISDDEVNASMTELARSNRMTVEQLRVAMESEGIDFDDVYKDIKERLTIQRVVENQVMRRVVVTDAEVDEFLASPKAQSARARYNVSHILLNINSTASQEAIESVEKQAQKVRDRIAQGMDFASAAKSYSEAGDAIEGGALGWRTPAQLPAIFLDALDGVGPGEVTRVFRSPNGFHILKLNDIEGKEITEVTQTKVRHILVRSDAFTSNEEAARRLELIRDRITNGDDFAALALAHSDDTVSSVEGGDLGWLSPGDTVKPFEDAMDTLEIGEVSRPVISPYGVHIIQVTERRKATPTEMDRSIARRQLRAAKVDEKLQEWIDEIRDQAYIKVL